MEVSWIGSYLIGFWERVGFWRVMEEQRDRAVGRCDCYAGVEVKELMRETDLLRTRLIKVGSFLDWIIKYSFSEKIVLELFFHLHPCFGSRSRDRRAFSYCSAHQSQRVATPYAV